jgi:hypothetical protein
MVGATSVVSVLSASYGALVTYSNGSPKLPPRTMLAGVAALVGVENAGGAAIYNGNMGNLSASEGDVYANPHAEPGAPSYFISFYGVGAGAGTLWLWLMRHYRAALLAAYRGDPGQMARELYRTGYVSALPGVNAGNEIANYAKGAWAYYRKVWAETYAYSFDSEPEATVQAWAGVLLGGLSLGAMGVTARAYA